MLDKKQREEDLQKLIASGGDQISSQDAVRLPNAYQKGQTILSLEPNQDSLNQGVASPF